MASVDVITSDARPGELLLVVRDAMSAQQRWCSNDRRYTRYQDAFMALGATLDE
jgi:hypothetical protein|nr:hypothetical protein [Salinicola salarius]